MHNVMQDTMKETVCVCESSRDITSSTYISRFSLFWPLESSSASCTPKAGCPVQLHPLGLLATPLSQQGSAVPSLELCRHPAVHSAVHGWMRGRGRGQQSGQGRIGWRVGRLSTAIGWKERELAGSSGSERHGSGQLSLVLRETPKPFAGQVGRDRRLLPGPKENLSRRQWKG